MTGPGTALRKRRHSRPDRVYLGWEYALVHGDPGPPPRRPVPPGQEQLNPGWVAAQRREERRLSRPLKAAGASCLTLAALAAALGGLGVLSAALTGIALVSLLTLAALCGRGIWRGEQALRARIEREEHRVARARAAQEKRLFGWQEEHARRFRDWQGRTAAFRAQLQWYGVTLPADIDRVDVAGGTLAGWSAMITMVAGLRLAAGGEVSVIDLSEGAVASDLLAAASRSGLNPLVWVLPDDLPRFDLGTGLPGEALADVLAVTAAAGAEPASPADQAQDNAILERIAEVLGPGASIGQITAGLRVLAQIGDPESDVRRGLLSTGQVEAITVLYGRAASAATERALALEARLRKLERLGTALVSLPHSRLRVAAVDRGAGVSGSRFLGSYVVAGLTHLLRQQSRKQPWQHTVLLAGAEKLSGDVLDRLSDACEATGTGLVLAYRTLLPHVKERLGRGNAAVAFMRLGNAEDARAASEQIGTEHRFVLAQLTDTVGSSITDNAGGSYTSTVGTADSVGLSTTGSQTTGHSGGRGQTWAGLSPFAQRSSSAHQDTSYSDGVSDSESITRGINTSTAWGWQTSQAVGTSTSQAQTSQRSREFLVEQHELQQLPPSAMIVSYASAAGRRVVLADANPGIAGLPIATLDSLDDVMSAGPAAAMDPPAAPALAPAAAPVMRPVLGPVVGSAAAWMAGAAPPDARVPEWDSPGPAAGIPEWAGPGMPPEEVPGSWVGPVPPPVRDPAAAPVSWREEDAPPPNLGPPAEPLDWRRRRE